MMSSSPPSETAERSSLARLGVFALKLLVSASAMYWLLTKVDVAQLATTIRQASLAWLAAALALYLLMIVTSAWRWQQLLGAQQVSVPGRTLVNSYLVATFFNNFLPSNIGGDVVRIRDTAPAAGSKTLATTVVALDRAIGLVGLLLIAAVGSSLIEIPAGDQTLPVWPWTLWTALFGFAGLLALAIGSPTLTSRLLAPARRIHAEWVGQRLEKLTLAFSRFREEPGVLFWCLAGAIGVQAVLVLFYLAVAHSIGITIGAAHLAVLVPVSFVVQMLPVSVNGLGVREATFSYYFVAAGFPIDAALALSLLGTLTIMLFSLSGAVVYAMRH